MWLLALLIAMAEVPPAQVLQLAQSGNAEARLQAALLHRKGGLPQLSGRRAEAWFQTALRARMPGACLEQARVSIDRKKDPESDLRCAADAKIAEAQYLLGLLLLNRTAAEDEPRRFEGMALLALSAKGGYSAGLRRWEAIAVDLSLEDLERVEQIANEIFAAH